MTTMSSKTDKVRLRSGLALRIAAVWIAAMLVGPPACSSDSSSDTEHQRDPSSDLADTDANMRAIEGSLPTNPRACVDYIDLCERASSICAMPGNTQDPNIAETCAGITQRCEANIDAHCSNDAGAGGTGGNDAGGGGATILPAANPASSGWVCTDPDNGDVSTGSLSSAGGNKADYSESGSANHFCQAWNTSWTAQPTVDASYQFTARLYAGTRTSATVILQTYGRGSNPRMTVNLATCAITSQANTLGTPTAVSAGTNTCDIVIAGAFRSQVLTHNGAVWNVTIETTSGATAGGTAISIENVSLLALL